MKVAMIAGAVALVVGTAAGLGAGAFVVRTRRPMPPEAAVESGTVGRDRTLELVKFVVQQPPALAAPTLGEKPSTEEEEPRLSPEEASARWKEHFSASAAQIEREPRDPAWASQTEHAFQQDFAAQAQAFQARLVDVQCRRSGCLARVEWDSYTKAMSRFTDIPHHNYSTNCAVAIQVGDRPADPGRPHQATVIFRCDRENERRPS